MPEAKTSSGVLIFVSCCSQVSLDLLLNKVLAHSCCNLLCSSVTQEPYWCGRGIGCRGGKAFCSMILILVVSLCPCAMTFPSTSWLSLLSAPTHTHTHTHTQVTHEG